MTPTIAVIGGGASGALVAVQLLRQAAGQPLHVQVIEKREQIGPGLAYGTRCQQHMLNVAAARMSALPDQPNHFLHWLQRRNSSAVAGTFAPRAWYGEYLRELLEDAVRSAAPGTQLERISDEAVALRARDAVRPFADAHPTAAPYKLALRSGRVLSTARVVLALGNFPPVDPALAEGDFRRAKLYVRDPWSPGALDGLAGDESLLLIGSGLTAVDLIAELHGRGHHGRIVAISRHGLLPQAHEYGTATHPLNGELAKAHGVRPVLRVLRAAAAHATAQERGWRGVMDAIRPRVQEVWLALSPAERSRFLRHARTYWDVHRHRVAPEVSVVVQSLRSSGQLEVRAARLLRYHERIELPLSRDAALRAAAGTAAVTLRPRGVATEETVSVARVINCTGPSTRLRDADSPLLRTLVDAGLARYDELGLGLDINSRGELVNAAGAVVPGLFAIGPLRKGALWESTAIPEIRVQAAELAHDLLALPVTRQNL